MPDQILVVEDDDNLAFVLCEALQRQGYRAEAVATLAAMRERLTAAPYDLLLLDLRLPDGDGLDAIPQCRELAPRHADHRHDGLYGAADRHGGAAPRGVRLLHQAAEDLRNRDRRGAGPRAPAPPAARRDARGVTSDRLRGAGRLQAGFRSRAGGGAAWGP